jgi:hypothetical protein
MKVYAIGKYVNGSPTLTKIGDSDTDAKWLVIPRELGAQFVDIRREDDVEITFNKEGRDNILTSIKKIGGSSAPANLGNRSGYQKTPEEKNSIKNQAIGKMVATTMTAFQGVIDFNSLEMVESTIERLYKKYSELVG